MLVWMGGDVHSVHRYMKYCTLYTVNTNIKYDFDHFLLSSKIGRVLSALQQTHTHTHTLPHMNMLEIHYR